MDAIELSHDTATAVPFGRPIDIDDSHGEAGADHDEVGDADAALHDGAASPGRCRPGSRPSRDPA